MAKFRKSFIALALALTIALTLGMTACAGGGENKPDPDNPGGGETTGTYTYRTYTTTSPSNWNLLSQTDNNDRQVSNYLNSSFFEFDFKRDSEGEIIDGAFEVKYSAATKLEDVTKTYAGNEKWGIPAGTTGNRAWKLTLRNDLKWNDGTAIKAEDFVYSMEQTLDPKFKNRLASEYYSGNAILHNARNYVYQSSSDWFNADGPYTDYVTSLDDKIIFTLGNTAENTEAYGGAICSMRTSMGFTESYNAEAVATYLANNGVSATKEAILSLEGKTFSEIKADTALKATWDAVIGWWQTDPNEELDFFVTYYTYPAMSMSDVGIIATGEYELTLIFDNTFDFIDEDGNLTYETAYYMSDLPLVKRDIYEASKQEPVEGATLWTSNYGSSVATTASWGPYMLTNYQAGSTYTLSKNANWYGYGMDEYKGQYQTDQIVCRTIPEWETAWQAFQLGELDDIGIDPSVAATYRTSSQAVFTPSDLVASIHLQSSREALEEQQEKAGENVNKTILMQKDFRKALSLAIDRAAYAQAATTSSLAGLGYFNSCHYYDVAHGGRYRDTEVAKRALLLTYGAEEQENGSWKVGETVYDNIDDAEEALTGYNLTLARQLVDSAYEAAKAAGDITDADTVVLKFGTSEDNTSTRRHYDFLNKAWTELMKGTKLEGRFRTEFDGSHGTQWANDFRSGQYEVAPASGFSGGAWNPAYFIGSEVSMSMNSLRYNCNWDTTKESITISFKNADGEDEEYTLTIDDWYNSLNGSDKGTEDFSLYPVDSQLAIVAALEQAALQSYWDIPTFYSFTAELHSYKTEYATYEYNTFMSYGGVRYMTYNYNDAEWANYVASQPNKTLNYAK